MKVGEYIGKKGFNERDIERAVRENMIKNTLYTCVQSTIVF